MSYPVSYAVALAIVIFPDIQEDFLIFLLAQQARGYEMSKKGRLSQRIKGVAQIVYP